jgi:glycosyltransferase involved in cell wall biosynthesis
MQSVVTQIFTDFEYILIDGGSDDGSVEIIKKYADKVTYWVSESDTGIYNGMNKGIKQARGDYCLFLNSGDWLINSNTLKDVFDEIKNYSESDIYYSDCINQNNILTFLPKLLSIEFFIAYSINHQNSIIKKELFYKHGFYNENIKIVSDWAFFLFEFWIYKSKFSHIKTHIALYDTNGISCVQVEQCRSEMKTVITDTFKEFSQIFLDYVDYKLNLPTVVYSNIQQRQGLGLKFILKCFKHCFFRIRKHSVLL